MLEISYTSQFKKDYKKAKKQGRDLSRLGSALLAIALDEHAAVAHAQRVAGQRVVPLRFLFRHVGISAMKR